MTKPIRVLICDDDSTFHLSVKYALKGQFDFRSAFHADEALTVLKNQSIDVLLLDIQMRTPNEGIHYLPIIREADPNVAIIMTSGLTDFESVSSSLKRGALDYVTKDFKPEDLKHRIETVLRQKSLIDQVTRRDFEVKLEQKNHQLIGNSTSIQNLRKTLDRLRATRANILITGETGVGKEVVARLLREQYADGTLAPFVSIDSATIQSSTAESILFGHEKGAFTGADRQSKGIFEEADGGTVYFDEIGNMPLEIQSKLLRVLQEKEVLRMGSSKPIQLDFRIIAATNRNLEEMAKRGEFKDDLLQRIQVIPLHIPPLRERTEDIPTLVEHFSKKHSNEGKHVTFTSDALELLSLYDWPGNVRELNNTIAYVLAMSETDSVGVADLPPKLREKANDLGKTLGKPTPIESGVSLEPLESIDLPLSAMAQGTLYERISAVEKAILVGEFKASDGNISVMAIRLGVDRSHLYKKLKEHSIHSQKTKKGKDSG